MKPSDTCTHVAYVILAVVVVLIVLAIGKGAGARRSRGPKIVPKTLLTRNEKLFTELLVRSLPDHYVFPGFPEKLWTTYLQPTTWTSSPPWNSITHPIV